MNDAEKLKKMTEDLEQFQIDIQENRDDIAEILGCIIEGKDWEVHQINGRYHLAEFSTPGGEELEVQFDSLRGLFEILIKGKENKEVYA